MEVLTFAGGAFVQNTLLAIGADGRRAVLVDPGAATARALAEARRRDLDVAALLLTHAHLDHVEGVALAKRATGAPIRLHPLERPLYDAAPAEARRHGVPFETPPPPDASLAPGDVLEFGGSGLEVVFAPGHSPGHVIFRSTSEPTALVGDVIFAGSIGRTDLAGGDHRTLLESIRRRVLTMPDETRLHPGHGPPTTVGRERATNPFLAPQYAGLSA